MSLKYNTFRPDRYLRSLFVEGRYFLAEEATDLELEIYDFVRKSLKNNIGDVAIGNAWKVTRYSATQLLVSPGEAWFNGLPFELRAGKDWLLTAGTAPTGVSISDEPSGLGKLVTFTTGSIPSDTYRLVIKASEQIITATNDPFLQNVNIPEQTGEKIRLLYTLNVVSSSNQGSSPAYDTTGPVPFVGEIGSYSAVNLSNIIKITPSNTSGYLITLTDLTTSAKIDGRSVELTLKNPVGANPFPTGTDDQDQFSNGTLIDVLGNEYHINAIFNGVTSDQTIIRISKEVGQSDPIIPNISGSPVTPGFVPYYIKKKEVYYTDDSTGVPTGNSYWHFAQTIWDNASGFVHQSVITDLRDRVISESDFEDIVNAKFDLSVTGGGTIDFNIDGQTLSWSGSFNVVNPSGQLQTIAPNTAIVLNGGSLAYSTNLFASTPQTISLGNQVLTSTAGGSTLTLSGSPDLTAVSIGNVVAAPTASGTFSPGNVANSSGLTITIASHGFNNGDLVAFSSTGTLPAGLTQGLQYYVINTTTNTFQVTANLSGAQVTYTNGGSGTHTAYSKYTSATSITAINNITKTLTLASSLTATNVQVIVFLDSYAPGTAPLSEQIYILAVSSGGYVVVGERTQFAAGQNNVVYDGRVQYPSGLTSSTHITIPPNINNFGRQQYYDPSSRILQVYANQLIKYQGVDWSTFDDKTVFFNYNLANDTELHFRIDALPAGPLGSSGGGASTLQQAYNNGNTINTTSGVPFTIIGSGSGKVALFQGDIDVTGVIDPAGLQLDAQASNPLAGGAYGIWVNNSGQLIHEGTSESNISQRLANLESGASIAVSSTGAISGGVSTIGSGLSVNVDNSTIGITADALYVKASGITAAQLATSVAGNGLSGGAGTPLAVNTDGTTVSITADTVYVKLDSAGAIITTGSGGTQGLAVQLETSNPTLQIATNNLGVKLDGSRAITTGIAGIGLNIDNSTLGISANVLSVSNAPKNVVSLVAGQSFSANTSYLVRWGQPANSEVANRVYLANATTASNGNYLAIGIFHSSTAVTAGNTISVTTQGSYTIGSLDATFSSGLIGEKLFLASGGTGGYNTAPSTTTGDAQYVVGVVQSSNQIWVDLKGLAGIVPEPLYDERIVYPSGLAANTTITIPVNSRNSNIQETYSTTNPDLKIYINQLLKFINEDWTPVSNTSGTLSFPFDLSPDTIVHFRKDPLSSGTLTASGGGGGTQTLQQTYNYGNTITTTTGTPFTVGGTATKVAVFNGDITVTGVVDPTGVQLTQQSGNPLGAGQYGIWIDNSGNLIHQQAGTSYNVTQTINNIATGGQTTIGKTYSNSTGSTIPAFTPVYAQSTGFVAPADGTNASKSRVIGVTTGAIVNSGTGTVAMCGYLTSVGGLTSGAYIYLGLTAGSLTDVAPTLGPYPSGFQIIKVGIMEGTDLILQIQYVGTL